MRGANPNPMEKSMVSVLVAGAEGARQRYNVSFIFVWFCFAEEI
jgi:hypothetical protein